jgi:SAM-dependent methyltransferase
MSDIAERIWDLQTSREAHDLLYAQQFSPYTDDRVVEALGVDGLLQLYLYDPDECKHAQMLLERWAPKADARILDVGCGNGHMAALCMQVRPDLDFTLLGHSPSQLAQCAGNRLQGDMHALPFQPETFDALFFCYSLGYGLAEAVFIQAQHALKQGGQLVVYDILADDINGFTPDAVLVSLGYLSYNVERLWAIGMRYGFTLQVSEVATPTCLNPRLGMHTRDAEALLVEVEPRLMIWEKYALAPD